MTRVPYPKLDNPDPGLTRVIVSDVHADLDNLRRLLIEIGVIDEQNRRQPGFWVLQLGDLFHLGHDSRFTDALLGEWVCAHDVFDVILLGNHELYHLHGLDCGRFYGMHEAIESQTRRALDELAARGQFRPAASVDGYLVTHAGIHETYAHLPDDAETAAWALCRRFFSHLQTGQVDPLITSIGPVRSGQISDGGMFWADLSEIRRCASHLPWPQIVGHTPQPRGWEACEVVDGKLWVCDAGAALSGAMAALVKQPGQDGWTPVVVRGQPTPRGASDAARELRQALIARLLEDPRS